MQETTDFTNSTNSNDPAGAQPDTAQPEPATDLEQRLKQAEQAAQEHQEAYLRARADSDNMKKRSQTEIANAHKFAVENFVTELLPVKDSLEAALASASTTVESMRAGVELTLRQLTAVFEKFNVKEVDPSGQKFDPHRHQAISTVASGAEPNTVVQVLQKGYLLHDRVVRPALVTVSKPKGIES